MWFVLFTIFDQVIKYFIEQTKLNVKIIDEIFNFEYAQNTRWSLWNISR